MAWRVPAFLMMTLAALALSRPAEAQTAEWDALVAAAKKEGRLVFYNGTTLNIPRAVTKLFEQKYGITVDTVEGAPQAIRERVRAENAAGRAIGDVRLSGVTAGAIEAASGLYQKHTDLPNRAKVLPVIREDRILAFDQRLFIPVANNRFTLMVNTNLVPDGQEPKSWHDLLDPKWRGKIISTDPRASGSAQGTFAALYDKFGLGFLEKLAEQNLTFDKDSRVLERRVAQGEFAVNAPFVLSDLASLQGLPVKAIPPAEGAAYVTTVIGVLKSAPHPNAAQLFLDFYLSDEAQSVVSSFGAESVTGVVAESVPPYMRQAQTGRLLGQADPFKLDDMVVLYKKIFGDR